MKPTHVYRRNHPPGRKGALCRVVRFAGLTYWPEGSQMIHGGTEMTLIEFEDGEQREVQRAAIALIGSKYARQTLARVARGDIPVSKLKRREAAHRKEAGV